VMPQDVSEVFISLPSLALPRSGSTGQGFEPYLSRWQRLPGSNEL
jgi:hypothetical protein